MLGMFEFSGFVMIHGYLVWLEFRGFSSLRSLVSVATVVQGRGQGDRAVPSQRSIQIFALEPEE